MPLSSLLQSITHTVEAVRCRLYDSQQGEVRMLEQALSPKRVVGLATLLERHGFTTVGIYKEMGRLDGRWVDTIIMEKLLS